MTHFKKNGGFTLVELIVVIAILAILAGIAVPAYSSYLRSAKKASDITALAAVKTACVAAMADQGAVTEIVVAAADEQDEAGNVTATGKISDITVTVGGENYLLYTASTDAAVLATVAVTDFNTYMAAVPCLSYFNSGAIWTVADGWAE